ncbi:hypothetical protein EJ05DRAFT_433082 [Pseudovirgaria hyperparasitica]|uniref:Sequence orphan n=1 Tax=Pseudovirgaria hyperparasitica TaxID=470096 RepID=A0A6A6WLP9_9PEZI|nr:uncharacterized protein EJ05DRAFT_433082 [Pseudovirgaria hyperparasitica]KAF2762929.1 hypothetical protein EJ05DRAFT_433082 [Pseudovirgaria hyperparasitica]
MAPVTTWNTKNLGLRLGVDLASAATAGALVAPLITIIDRGIIENSSGRNTLGQSLQSQLKNLLLRPHRFLISKPFALIFALYTGTYMTANAIDTASSTLRSESADKVTSGLPKFLATSTANLSLCLYKDSQFTKLFSTHKSPRPVPPLTMLLFALRDSCTVFASFNVPPLLAPRLADRFGAGLERHVSSATAAQFLAPAAVQVVSTPLHLLGLDLYNRDGVRARERVAKVASEWGKSCLARIARIVPAFGLGGVVNARMRCGLMAGVE